MQLGHGGWTSIGNMGVAADTLLVGAARDIAFTAGADNDSYAQLGNGGRAARGDHSADIEVYAGRDINFTAGGGALSIVNEMTADFHQATNLGATTLGTGQGTHHPLWKASTSSPAPSLSRPRRAHHH
ncbi:MAG: hypothetical protein R3F31_25705 [Verrucomicrobiales bacterium]